MPSACRFHVLPPSRVRYAAGLPPGRRARPHVGAVHRKHPCGLRVVRVRRPSASRCRRPTSACCRRCAPSASRGGRGDRCRSGSAGRAGRDCSTGARNAGRARTPGRACGRKVAATPWLSGFQSRPASVDSNTPPLDMPMYMCAGSRGSTITECIFGPSGVPSWSPPHHALRCGCALKPATPFHVAPPSSERNKPCGDVPAYQTPGCEACPGVSQNVWSTTRPLSGAKAGGAAASFHVRPPSCERNTVGPRCPVRAAASSVLPSRGSSIAWCTMCPRKVGGDSFHERRRRVARERPQSLAGRDQEAHAARRGGAGVVWHAGHGGPCSSWKRTFRALARRRAKHYARARIAPRKRREAKRS